MIKADGYGLGAVEIARALLPSKPFALGVATLDEGVELRMAGIGGRVIVFTPCLATDTVGLAEHALDAAVLGPEGLALVGDAEIDLHIEIDSGMGRAGFAPEDVGAWSGDVEPAAASGRLISAYTHFHSAGVDDEATQRQLRRYQMAVSGLGLMPGSRILRQVANSDAIRSDRQYHLDLVRPGLYLYGGGRGRSPVLLPDPEAVVSIRARVLEVRDLPPGSTVSYGAPYVTQGAERVATVGFGYADGLPWMGSNRGHVLVGGQLAPIRGRVCMDVIAVDVTGVSRVQCGDVVTLLGEDGSEAIELRDLADRCGTIEYEVLTGLGGRLPRVHTRSD